jgi:AraC family transcriptional regulator of adaptative response/methylated-DNA-[protein]-cysteine methyltransferase
MKMTPAKMWKAVTDRAKALDGQFIYAVKSTKIYCRPSCPSRRPKKDNVQFFETAEAAQNSGFRACKRCSPDATRSNAEMMVEKLQTYIQNNLNRKLTLADMGGAIGTSPFHLQRLFKTVTGLSPSEYIDECRLQSVKKELIAGRPVTEALYEAGYSSSSRLYERSRQNLGMTPGAYAKRGAGELISFAFVHSPFGLLLMAATARGLCFLQFGGSEKELLDTLLGEYSSATVVENAQSLSPWIERLSYYFTDASSNLNIPLDIVGTTFQQAVWRYLREIPAGETRSYSDVAEAIGQPQAVRAVARACASNRVALAIPCHRVVRQDGSLGGYRWGIELKQELLKKEQKAD